MKFYFLTLILLLQLCIPKVFSSASPRSNNLNQFLYNIPPSRNFIISLTPRRYWFNQLKSDIKRQAYESATEKMFLPEYESSLRPIFKYMLKKEPDYPGAYTSVLSKIFLKLQETQYSFLILITALKVCVEMERIQLVSSWTYLPDLFHKVMSAPTSEEIISCIRKSILSINPTIQYNSRTVLHYALMTGDKNIFHLIPSDISYIRLSSSSGNTPLQFPQLLDSFNVENSLIVLTQVFFNEIRIYPDTLKLNVLMLSYIKLLDRFFRKDLLNSLLDTIIEINTSSTKDDVLNYNYIFYLCSFTGKYELSQKVLNSSPESTQDNSTVLHIATRLNDEVLFQLAPKTTKYMSILDSDNKFVVKYVFFEKFHYLCLRRLALEHLGLDNLFFYSSHNDINYNISRYVDNGHNSSISASIHKQTIPFEYVESESSVAIDYKTCDFLMNSSDDDSNTNTLKIYYEKLFDYLLHDPLKPDVSLILNLFSLSDFYDHSMSIKLLLKCIQYGTYSFLKIVSDVNPSFSIDGLNIFQLSLKHDNANLFEIVPKDKKFVSDMASINDSLNLISSSDSIDLLLKRLAFEYQRDTKKDECCFSSDTGHVLLKEYVLSDLFFEIALRYKKYDQLYMILQVAYEDFQPEFWRILNFFLECEHIDDFFKGLFERFAQNQIQIFPIHHAVAHNILKIFKILPESEAYLLLKSSEGKFATDLINYDSYGELYEIILNRIFIEYKVLSCILDDLDVSKLFPEQLVSILWMTVQFNQLAHFKTLSTLALKTYPDLFLDELFLKCIDSPADKFEFIKELIRLRPSISHNSLTIFHFAFLHMNHEYFDLAPIGIEYSDLEDNIQKLLTEKPVISVQWFRSFVKMVLVRFSNLELFSNAALIVKLCFNNMDLLQLDDSTDLELSNSLLNLVKHFSISSKLLIKKIFHDSCKEKMYKAVQKFLEIDPFICDHEDRNILHLFAIFKDKKLFDLLPSDSIYCPRLDSKRMTPIDYITNDYGILALLRTRLAYEFSSYHIDTNFNFNFNFNELFWKLDFYNHMLNIPKLNERLNELFTLNRNHTNATINCLQITRSKVLLTTIVEVANIEKYWYDPNKFPNLKITFVGEKGIDAGGLRTEWYSLLIESFFKAYDPNGSVKDYTAPLFLIEDPESGLYAPNPEYHPNIFKGVGAALSYGFANKFTIGVEIIESFYRKLYGFDPVNFAYLPFHSPILYKNLHSILSLDEAAFKESFPGETRTPNELFESTAYDSMYGKHKERIDAMVEGFLISRNPLITQKLTIEEFKSVLSGKKECTPSEFLENCTFLGSYENDVNTFKKIVNSFDSKRMSQLIKFTTGRSLLPHNGILGLSPNIHIVFKAHSQNHYPTASTCFNHLRIPIFTSEQDLESKLIFAIENANTFGRD